MQAKKTSNLLESVSVNLMISELDSILFPSLRKTLRRSNNYRQGSIVITLADAVDSLFLPSSMM